MQDSHTPNPPNPSPGLQSHHDHVDHNVQHDDCGCDPSDQGIRSVFTSNNIRCTQPRLKIYQALINSKDHPTAEHLHEAVRATDPGISLATIYNTLELLVENGLARRISNRCPGSGASRYDADQSQHLHLVLNDGRVVDAPKSLSQQLTSAIPDGLMEQLAKHAGVGALKIEIVEDTAGDQAAAK